MSTQFANNQPAGYHNHLRKVAIVGAAGQLGSVIMQELLRSVKHIVTAITRRDSNSQPAEGVHVAKVDYGDESTIANALKGQDALIIIMNTSAPPDTSTKLVEAAAKVGVPWVLPDEWGACNGINLEWERDVFLGPPKQAIRELIEKLGFSLSTFTEMYGFDFQNREVTFFDYGNARINTSTWEHEARAVTSLLSLKILPEDESDTSVTLDRNFKNKFAFLSSFVVNQKDIFESVKRVTGTTDTDRKIKNVGSRERYEEGIKDFQLGNMFGFIKFLYARSFYPEEPIVLEKYGPSANSILSLPKEDLDTCTNKAIEKNRAMQQK